MDPAFLPGTTRVPPTAMGDTFTNTVLGAFVRLLEVDLNPKARLP